MLEILHMGGNGDGGDDGDGNDDGNNDGDNDDVGGNFDEVCLKFFTRRVMQENLRLKTAPS